MAAGGAGTGRFASVASSVGFGAGNSSSSPDSGSSTGEPDTIQVIYNVADLDIGTYETTITVTDENATNSPQTIDVSLQVKPVPGDFDADLDIDQEDFGHLQVCLTGMGVGPPPAGCEDADLDNDLDVDQEDFGIFQACMSGADVPGDPTCRQGGGR